jgi:Predicted hydrolases or acyltransferases (alpha/beta hydrolase superfamily)
MIAHWPEGDAQLGGVKIHYYRTGRGDKRPLVLVHGFSDNGLCWTPVAQALEEEYDIVMPDMRGHGHSERVRPGEAVDMAADLARLIESLGLDRPVICGHSMGAMVTYQTVLRFPHLARAFALEDPPWFLSGPSPSAPVAASGRNPIAEWAKSLATIGIEELRSGYRRDHQSWPPELIEAICASKKQLDQGIIDIVAGKVNSTEWPWQEHIQSIEPPMLLFTGDPALGAIVKPDVVARIRELKRNVEFIAVPGVGHLIRFDAFPVFMDGLRAFLRRPPQD